MATAAMRLEGTAGSCGPKAGYVYCSNSAATSSDALYESRQAQRHLDAFALVNEASESRRDAMRRLGTKRDETACTSDRCSPCAASTGSSSNIEEFLETTAKEPGSASAQQRAVCQRQPVRLSASAVSSADSSRTAGRRELKRTQTDVPEMH